MMIRVQVQVQVQVVRKALGVTAVVDFGWALPISNEKRINHGFGLGLFTGIAISKGAAIAPSRQILWV
jgi:hypothetical protein